MGATRTATDAGRSRGGRFVPTREATTARTSRAREGDLHPRAPPRSRRLDRRGRSSEGTRPRLRPRGELPLLHHVLVYEADLACGRREVLVRLVGDADAVALSGLDALRRSLPDGADVHLDVGELGFVGAAFLGFLAGLAREVTHAGGRLTLGSASPHLARLLSLCGMTPPIAPASHASRAVEDDLATPV
jgi:anti-anti-sigma factor